MEIKGKKYIFIGISAIFLFLFYFNNEGVSKKNLEYNARKFQEIENDWKVVKDITTNSASLLFYSKDLNFHTLSVYEKSKAPLSKYSFKFGGAFGEISNDILKLIKNNKEEVIFVSLNKLKVAKVEIDNGSELRELFIEDSKPFSFIIPYDGINVKFYDATNKLISNQFIIERSL